MTMIRGVRILAAPCCGAQYSFPRYMSMNFMADEYWTDGWREGSLMPNDEGLRLCKCGQCVLIREMIAIDSADTSDLPNMKELPAELLDKCIAQAGRSEEMEVAARRTIWRNLNSPYREIYRQHRDAEEAATRAKWDAANPDRRTWLDKLLGRKAPRYVRSPESPLTYPPFEVSKEQMQNMERLSWILHQRRDAGRNIYSVELAELYREQGRFDESEQLILTLNESETDVTSQLISRLNKAKQTAPARYRM